LIPLTCSNTLLVYKGYLIRLIPVPVGEFEKLRALTSTDENTHGEDNDATSDEEKLKV
jgi:hypothetical protein